MPKTKNFDYELDLRGEVCPNTFVYTKIKAEELLEEGGGGKVLKVILDFPEAVGNVPESMKEEGYEVLGVERKEGGKEGEWEVFIKLSKK